MTGAEYRHQVSARAVAATVDIVRERIQLADCTVEVFLADLVVGSWHLFGYR
jgi:hypothetical protein